MKVILNILVVFTIFFSNCTSKQAKVVDTKTNQAFECGKEPINESLQVTQNEDQAFVCEFQEFWIASYKVPNMENQEYHEKIYAWFKKNVFYGPEIYSLQGIFFNGSITTGRSFATYNTNSKIIQIFPNNTELLAQNPVPPTYAKRMGKDEIDPKSDYRYWLYSISHEYNHHSSISYGIKDHIIEKNFGGTIFNDIILNKKGKKLLDLIKITNKPEFNDQFKVNPILPYSGGSRNALWPEHFIPVSFNQYLWTKAELLTRGIGLYTYPVPDALQNENSVNAYGGIINDYWWFHYYNANVYEKNKDKDSKPIQKPVDDFLVKWAEFIDNEWFNDDDQIGSIFMDVWSKIFITGNNIKSSNIKLVNTKDKNDVIEFEKVDKIANLKYYWRPFDSRKAKVISLESNVFISTKEFPENEKYILYLNNQPAINAFDLEEGESRTLLAGYDIRISVYKKDKKIYFENK